MSYTLTLRREPTGAIELRRNTFQIVLDGNPAGTIDRHQTVELQVDPGQHTLQVKTGRYSSPARTFNAADGANLDFRCNGAILWPQYVASLFVPTIGLRLNAASGRTTSPHSQAEPCSAAGVQHHAVLGLAPDRLEPACLASNAARRDPATGGRRRSRS